MTAQKKFAEIWNKLHPLPMERVYHGYRCWFDTAGAEADISDQEKLADLKATCEKQDCTVADLYARHIAFYTCKDNQPDVVRQGPVALGYLLSELAPCFSTPDANKDRRGRLAELADTDRDSALAEYDSILDEAISYGDAGMTQFIQDGVAVLDSMDLFSTKDVRREILEKLTLAELYVLEKWLPEWHPGMKHVTK